jgi:hypothetical protein
MLPWFKGMIHLMPSALLSIRVAIFEAKNSKRGRLASKIRMVVLTLNTWALHWNVDRYTRGTTTSVPAT